MDPLSDSIGLETAFGYVPSFVSSATGKTYRRLVDALAETSVSLDRQALNVFLRTGHYLAADTPFREIRRCSPDPVFAPPSSLSRESAMEGYIELFRQAVRRRLHPDSVVALSGGRDSRHIVFELYSQKAPPRYVVTVAVPGREGEVAIAAAVAARLGIPHRVFTPPPQHAARDEADSNLLTDFLSGEHRWMLEAARHRDASPWWDGIAGDVLSAGLFIDDRNTALFEQGRLDELAELIACYEPLRYLWLDRLPPRDDALAKIRAELERHSPSPNPVGSYYLWNRTRNAVGASAFGLLAVNGGPTVAPFLDVDLWPFLASLPFQLTVDHRFHTDTIHRTYPQWSDIPFFEKKTPPPLSSTWLSAASLTPYLWSKPVGRALRTAARQVAVLLDPRRAPHLAYMLPQVVYCAQIEAALDGRWRAS